MPNAFNSNLKHLYPTYLVGGTLRDEILGRPSSDLDFVVLAPTFEAMLDRLVGSEGYEVYQSKPEFMAVSGHHPEYGKCDFTVARTEAAYSDCRHPDVVMQADSIEHDLSRRDFTMNAIARCVDTGLVLDPFEGRLDIERRIIRCVGDKNKRIENAKERLSEDRLRILRALRFCLQLGFGLGIAEHAYISDCHKDGGLAGVSSHRMFVEVGKMLAYGTAETIRLLSVYPGLLRECFCEKTGLHLLPSLAKRKGAPNGPMVTEQ